MRIMVTRGLLSFVRWDLFEFGPEARLWRAPCAGECAGDRTVPSRPWWLAGLTATSPNDPSCIFQDCPFFGDDQAVWRASDHPLLNDLSGNRIPKRTMRSLVYLVLGMSRGNLKSPSDAGAFFPRGTRQPKSLGLREKRASRRGEMGSRPPGTLWGRISCRRETQEEAETSCAGTRPHLGGSVPEMGRRQDSRSNTGHVLAGAGLESWYGEHTDRST